MSAIYLLTFTGGRNPETATSLRAAKAQGAAAVYVADGDGDLAGYQSRAHMAKDRDGDRPDLVSVVIRRVDRPEIFVRDPNQPGAWVYAVRCALEVR